MTRTTPTELLAAHKELTERARELMVSKNADYGADADALRNFRLTALVVGDLKSGILVRLCDKLARIGTFAKKGELAVKDESVEDTILDGINYLVILATAIREEQKTATAPPSVYAMCAVRHGQGARKHVDGEECFGLECAGAPARRRAA